MNTKLKNVADGRVLERTFQVGFKLEDVRVERRPYQYLYEDATGCIFMNQETFEQVPIAKENVTGGQYMKEGDVIRRRWMWMGLGRSLFRHITRIRWR